MTAALTVGQRVRLRYNEDRYPHFVAPQGATGTVTHADEYAVCVRLDDYLAGAETWHNEVHWYPNNGDDASSALEILP